MRADSRAGSRAIEPSAGTGALCAFALAAGAAVHANELSDRRADLLAVLLREGGQDPDQTLTRENADHLGAVLPPHVRADVVLMNPPFSATAGRPGHRRVPSVGTDHVLQALRRLDDGGRLIAVLSAAVRPNKLEGPYGRLFDADRDSFEAGPSEQGRGESAPSDSGRHQVVELSHLVGMSDRVLVPALTYLFRRVEEALDGAPTLIVIEEAWAALMHGRFADRLRQWLLTLRKRNAAVVVVAHSPAQFKDPAVKGAQLLVESCPTRIFLPNPDASEPDTAALYQWLGLNAAETARLAWGRKKRDYYVRSPSGARTFELALGPLEMAFLGTLPGRSADETVREAALYAQTKGETWPAEWLRLCGLPEEADVLARKYLGVPGGPC